MVSTNSVFLVLVLISLATPLVGMSFAEEEDSARNPVPEAAKGQKKIPKEAEDLLAVAEKKTNDLKTRADAAAKLGRFKEPAVVDRLLKLLPDSEGVLLFAVVNSLGEIGNPKAVPDLEKLLNSNRDLSGKTRAAVKIAIEECKKNKKNGS